MAINSRLRKEDKKFAPLDVIVGMVEFLLSGEALRFYLSVIIGTMAAVTLYIGIALTIGKFDIEYAQRLQIVGCGIIFVAAGWVVMWLSEPKAKLKRTKLTPREKRDQLKNWR